MNKTMREIFVGMLLGDGHIRRSGINKAYIAHEQSKKKKLSILILYKNPYKKKD